MVFIRVREFLFNIFQDFGKQIVLCWGPALVLVKMIFLMLPIRGLVILVVLLTVVVQMNCVILDSIESSRAPVGVLFV